MTDLEWLARNVHKWPESEHTHIMVDDDGEICFEGAEGVDHDFYPLGVDGYKGSGSVYTKQEWLAKRAELQNKPSWSDAPEWANWLGQNKDGTWNWYNVKPVSVLSDCYWMFYDGDCGSKTECKKAKEGQVLGNWQDTLEERPDRMQRAVDAISDAAKAMGEAVHVASKNMNTVIKVSDNIASHFDDIRTEVEETVQKEGNTKTQAQLWDELMDKLAKSYQKAFEELGKNFRAQAELAVARLNGAAKACRRLGVSVSVDQPYLRIVDGSLWLLKPIIIMRRFATSGAMKWSYLIFATLSSDR